MPPGYIDLSVLPAFLAAVTLLLLAPGPDMAFMVATGLRDGLHGTTRAALGITAGVSVYVVLTALGLGAFLAAAPSLIAALQLAGAAYLAHLAWTTWRSAAAPVEITTATTRAFRRGFLVNLANPKIALFFTAFLPQFLGDTEDNPTFQLLLLGTLLQTLGLLTDLAIGCAAGAVRNRLLHRTRPRTLLNRLAAATYATLATALLTR
ncbi:LysE family translocator [Saccharopolyspora sp. TS4A08]|uniref:LysE family translocator n=1 Tax=Saccharopolyspora ipomoeae TaxID=3042027 RepID=A0ABT6PG29_9PSEU|nr:LysE family translocator [Saccharopolyspora sp. TS4A08]MDI2026976.1 LysE family translocator [Saccharopolyspora sp. TS4A08]